MNQKVCSYCGKAVDEFIKTGMLGCANCYKAFIDAVEEYVSGVQEGRLHTGKKPLSYGENKELLTQYKRLLMEKEQAQIEGDRSTIKQVSQELYLLEDELYQRGLL